MAIETTVNATDLELGDYYQTTPEKAGGYTKTYPHPVDVYINTSQEPDGDINPLGKFERFYVDTKVPAPPAVQGEDYMLTYLKATTFRISVGGSPEENPMEVEGYVDLLRLGWEPA